MVTFRPGDYELISVLFIVLFALHAIAAGQLILYFTNNRRRIEALLTGLIFLIYSILFFQYTTTPTEVLRSRAAFLISLYILLVPLLAGLIYMMRKKALNHED